MAKRRGWTYRPNENQLHYMVTAFMGTRKHLEAEHPEVAVPSVSDPLFPEDKRALAIAHVRAHGAVVYDENDQPVAPEIGRYVEADETRYVPMP